MAGGGEAVCDYHCVEHIHEPFKTVACMALWLQICQKLAGKSSPGYAVVTVNVSQYRRYGGQYVRTGGEESIHTLKSKFLGSTKMCSV